MNILFVSMIPFESNASATIRNMGIIRGLAEQGHVVDTITPALPNSAISFDESINKVEALVRNSFYIDLNPLYEKLMAKKTGFSNEQKFSKTDSNQTSLIKRGLRCIIKFIFDNTAIMDAQKLNVNQVSKLNINYNLYDVIVSASDPKSSHLIVKKIFKKHAKIKAKWIQYWGDPMYSDITRKRDWRDPYVKRYECKIIEGADKIVYSSPLTLKVQREMYPEQSAKMDYANQVIATNNQYGETDRHSNESDLSIGYFGAYYSNVRNIIPLYNAALNTNYDLTICGSSDIKLDSVKNIKIFRSVPYEEVTQMESKSDVLVAICNQSGTQIPGKIFYYSGYNKPVIVILDGEYKKELKEYLETFNRYILCDNNYDSILEAFKKATSELQKVDIALNERLQPAYLAEKILAGI